MTTYLTPGVVAIAWLVVGAVVVVVAVWVLADLYWLWIRTSLKRRRERLANEGLREARAAFAEVTADLWSPQMDVRLATLAVLERFDRGDVVGDILVAFIRARLGHRHLFGGETGSFEDVRFALALLASRRVRLQIEGRGYAIDLTNLDFRGVPLRGGDLHGLNMAGCIFDGCDLRKAKMRFANFRGASFRGARLVRVTAQQADFSEAVLESAEMTRSAFGACRMMRADLSHADARESDFSSASLVIARAADADFTSSLFFRTDLTGADLTNADFTKARIGFANLADAEIGGALLAESIGLAQKQLDGAVGDTNTTVPERLKYVPMKARRQKPALEVVKSA